MVETAARLGISALGLCDRNGLYGAVELIQSARAHGIHPIIGTELELAGWRRDVSELYAGVRAEDKPERGHAMWRYRRDELFRTHPQSPLPAGHPFRTSGVPYWPYDPELRFELPLRPAAEPSRRSM